MGYRPEKVGPHGFALRFRPELFLPLDLGGQRADDDRYGQHSEKGEGVACDGEVKFPVGVGKDIVDTDDTDEGGSNAVDEAVGKSGCQGHHEDEDHGYKSTR